MVQRCLALCVLAGALVFPGTPASAQKIGSFVDGERTIYLELDQLVGGQPFTLTVRNAPADATSVQIVWSGALNPWDLNPYGIPGYLGPDLSSGGVINLGASKVLTGVASSGTNNQAYHIQAYVYSPSVGPRLSAMLWVRQAGAQGSDDGSYHLPIPLITREALPGTHPGWSRNDAPVKAGIPLPRGVVFEAAPGMPALTLKGPVGEGQFSTLAQWPDGSVKWALVEYRTDLAPDQSHELVSVNQGAGDFGGADLATQVGPLIHVDTGAIQFGVNGITPHLFQYVLQNGQDVLDTVAGNRLHLHDSQNLEWTFHPLNAVLRRNGPVRAEIQVDGKFTRSGNLDDDESVYIRCYLEGFNGSPFVRVTTSLRNSNVHYQQNLLFRGLFWQGQLLKQGPYDVSMPLVSTNGSTRGKVQGTIAGNEQAYFYQGFVNRTDFDLVSDPNATDYIPFVQRYSPDNFAIEGVREQIAGVDYTGGGQGPGFSPETEYADPAFLEINRSSDGKGVLLTVEHAHVTWPVALHATAAGQLGVYLFPLKDAADPHNYPLTWSTCETRTWVIGFEAQKSADPVADAARFSYPVKARSYPWAYNQSNVWPWKLVTQSELDQFIADSGIKNYNKQGVDPVKTVYRFANLTGAGNNRWVSTQYFYQWLRTGVGGAFLRSWYEATYKIDKMPYTFDNGKLQDAGTVLDQSNATIKDRFYDGSKHTYFQSIPDLGFTQGETYLLDAFPHLADTLSSSKVTSTQPDGNFVDGTYGAIANATLAVLSMGQDQLLEDKIRLYMHQWANIVFQRNTGVGIDTSTKGWQAAPGVPVGSSQNPDAYFVTDAGGKSSEFVLYGYTTQVWTGLRQGSLAYQNMAHYLSERYPGDPLIATLNSRASDMYHFAYRGAPMDSYAATGEYYILDVFDGDADDRSPDPFSPPGYEIEFPQPTSYILHPWVNLYLDQRPSASALSFGLELIRSMSSPEWDRQHHDPTLNHFVYRYLQQRGLLP